MKTRISLVEYLNSAPLGWSFLNGPLKGRFEVIPSVPSRCADLLASGEVDVGLIPSIEYQRIPNLAVIPGMSIACTSSVRSILLVQPPARTEIRSVALDTSSRTSVVLAKLLLELKMGLRPEYVPHVPDLDAMLKSCDAAVIIGDRALRVEPEGYRVTDLAEAWISWQHVPFVFAFWACRCDVLLPPDLTDIFRQAKEYGLAARPQIASSFSVSLGLPEPFLLSYLSDNVDYEMGPDHLRGLARFYSLAREEELIPDVIPVRFLDAGARVETPSV